MTNKIKKNFNVYFENKDLTQNEQYSAAIVKSLIRSILEPIASNNSKAIAFLRLKNIPEVDGLIKRLEYSANVTLKEFSDFEFSKFDVEDVGFVVLSTSRYNCALIYREVQEDKFEIYLKLNSKLVSDVYETLKNIFLINYDEEFYSYRPERRENNLLNEAIFNILKFFEETIRENEYNTKIQENYRNVNTVNTTFRNEIYQNVRQIEKKKKNQLSILDIYTRIFEKKTNDSETVEPIKKSISLIKSQIDQFKNFDVINLQEKNIKLIIQESIKMYANIAKEKNNKIVLIDEMAGVEANAFVDEEKFLIVINNIIKNANDAVDNDEIIVKLAQIDEKIRISFINHGEKIEQKNQEKIFEQGYTTKKDGWGTGLSVCKKLIGSQFGTLELTKSDEKETEFSILLPLAQSK